MHKKRKQVFMSFSLVILLVVFVTYFSVPKFLADEVYPLKYTDWIVKYSNQYDVPPSLVAAVILQESRFNPKAVSPVGAQGLMQFMPGTAQTMAKETGHWPKYDIFDPETSIEFGAAHLRDLLIKYDGDLSQALAGYNAGTGTVDRWVSMNIFEKVINSGSTSETVNYVKKVKKYEDAYRTIYKKELKMETAVPGDFKVDGKVMVNADLRTVSAAESDKKVRGLVWTQVFNSVFSFSR
jgi:soluble lytic murein transglycosylase